VREGKTRKRSLGPEHSMMIHPPQSPVRILNLGSGSKGNCSLVCHEDKILMVECGLYKRETIRRMETMGLDPDCVCGILISHSHSDHTRGATLWNKHEKAKILATKGTLKGARLTRCHSKTLKYGKKVGRKGFSITPIEISHDTREPCAFLVEVAGVRCFFGTDIGTLRGLDLSELTNLDYLYVEANHDETMLRTGSYPTYLKKRIAGKEGHLNNTQCGKLIRSLADQSPRLKAIMLAHLSEQNNDPVKALETAQEVAGELPGVRWMVAKQGEVTELA
jgi:phosphoribosyl 1,2-cyclic phosphodiesterase